jgi:hypothetical protein
MIAAEKKSQQVLVVAKTATSEPINGWFDRDTSLQQAVAALVSESRSAGDCTVQSQIKREMEGPFNFLVPRDGRLGDAAPRTRLAEIAFPREVRSFDGDLKQVEGLTVHIVAYAQVGA